jgi:hypothetical protein
LGAICHACAEVVELLDWGAARVLADFTMTGGIALMMAAWRHGLRHHVARIARGGWPAVR